MPTVPLLAYYAIANFLIQQSVSIDSWIVLRESRLNIANGGQYATIQWVPDCTPFDTAAVNFTYAAEQQDGDYHRGVLATSRNPNGCSVTARPQGIFTSDPQTGGHEQDFLPIDFTYPDAWDDGYIQTLYACPIINYLGRLDVLTSTSERPRLYAYGFRLSVGGHLHAPGNGTPTPVDYGDDYVTVQSANDRGTVYSAYLGGGVTAFGNPAPSSLVAVRDPLSTYSYGTLWNPTQPTITGFNWSWGDGTADTLEAAVNTPVHPGGVSYNDTAVPSGPVSHNFDAPSNLVTFRAIDSYGRKSVIGSLDVVFNPSDISAIHTRHGHLLTAQTATTGPGVRQVEVRRSVNTVPNLQPPVVVSGHSAPTLFVDALHNLFLHAMDTGSFVSRFFKSLDIGDTFVPLTVSPLDSVSYTNIVPFHSMLHGFHAVAGFAVSTTNIVFALYNGASWGAITSVTTLAGGARKSIACYQETLSGSSRLRIVAEGVDMCSLDYGATWTVTP